MGATTRFDLLLLGYRNDLARENVLRFLDGLSLGPASAVRVERAAPLPQRICAGIGDGEGLDLAARLRERGALVRLVPSTPEDEPFADAAPGDVRRASGPLRPFLLVLLLLAAAAAYVSSAPRRPRALPPERDSPFAASLAGDVRLLGSSAPEQLNDEAVALNDAGRYAEAARQVRLARQQHPDADVLRRNLQVILRNWAVAELGAGRIDPALALLDEALELGEHREVLAVLGVAHARRGAWEEAEGALARAVELGADQPATLLSLGKVYRQRGNRTGAVEMLQRAREKGAAGAEFEAELRRLERELDAEWDFDALRSAHFEISFDSGEDRSAVPLVLDGLERAYFDVGRFLDWYPNARVQVVLYPDRDFHDLTQSPDWTAGLYDGRIKLPVRGLRGETALLERILRHEYAHAVVAELSHQRCPTWLNEGVAIRAEDGGRAERTEWALDTIAGKRLFTLAELEPPFTRFDAARVEVAYAQSYLAVRSIVERHGERRLRDLLAELGSGASLDAAFQAVLLTRLASFEQGLLGELSG